MFVMSHATRFLFCDQVLTPKLLYTRSKIGTDLESLGVVSKLKKRMHSNCNQKELDTMKSQCVINEFLTKNKYSPPFPEY